VRFSTFDNLAQLALHEDSIQECKEWTAAALQALEKQKLPSRSWYDLAHQVTRCLYHERREEWRTILEICEEADPELARRQYRAVRTALLCAKARALSRTGEHAQAQTALAQAVRACPRGAVDPLIVLEASHGVCRSLRGDRTAGALHFDRALAACRAIGHRYHERWIDRDRHALLGAPRSTIAVTRPTLPLADAALLFSDIGTLVGAGHSIDLLAHRAVSLLQSTSLAPRVTVDSASGCEFQADPTADADTGPDGAFSMLLRGSDRRVIVRVRDVQGLEEIALLRGLAELVQAAVGRTAGADQEDDTLWPRTLIAGDDDTIFRSPRMLELVRVAMRLAATDLPVLITGETGTGKEIFARLIHDHSRVRRGPFVAFNCSAIPRELIESQLFGHRKGAFTGATDTFPGVIRAAAHGTLFLDEIADLDLMVQPKLLRSLERGEVHPVGELRPVPVPVRIVAATNGDVDALVEAGRFRSDLFYRLGVARLALPPLRERKDEIPALAELFLKRYSRECGRTGLRLGDDFVAALLLHDWPGNLRELANEMRRVVAMAADGDTLASTDLVPAIAQRWNDRVTTVAVPEPRDGVHIPFDRTLAEAVNELEQRFIEHALAATNGRVTEAADLLGLSRKGLFLKRRRRGFVGRHAVRIDPPAQAGQSGGHTPLADAAEA
jgi:DNA-binding NtrC family response regulator